MFRMGPLTRDVLLIRVDNIGDFVLWLDAAQALVQHYRAEGRQVVLLANQVWAPLAVECGLFAEVIPVHERRFKQEYRYRLHVLKQVRAHGFRTAIRVAYTRVLELNESLLRMSGAPERLGLEGLFDEGTARDHRVSDGWYTSLFPNEKQQSSEMRHNAALVRAIGDGSYRGKVADLRGLLPMYLPMSLLKELNGGKYFVLFPGATFSGRLWPAERYVEIARRLSEMTGWLGVVCGGPSEAEQAKQICAEVKVLNWTKRTTLTELAAVLAGAELVIGNESSAVHIAAAVGTRSVCLLGGGHFGRFVPYAPEETDSRPLPGSAFHRMSCFGCDWKCKFHVPKGAPVPCVDEISTEQAWASVEMTLREAPMAYREATGQRSVYGWAQRLGPAWEAVGSPKQELQHQSPV